LIQQVEQRRLRLRFWSPADNAGYGKWYVQEIEESGATIEYRETWGPQGLIEVKYNP